MPSPETLFTGGVRVKDTKETITEVASKFHQKGSAEECGPGIGRRGDSRRLIAATEAVNQGRPLKFTKLLTNVTVERSLGPVHMVIPTEATVEDLIAAALRQYVKEARRPVLHSAVASDYDLHYSQFTLQSLNREKKIQELGSRNFFMRPRKADAAAVAEIGGAAVVTSSEKVDGGDKKGISCFSFMGLFF